VNFAAVRHWFWRGLRQKARVS